MKQLFCIFSLCFCIHLHVIAQSDSLSLFRENNASNFDKTGNKKNVFFLNLTTLFRGGFALGYEKYFGFSGLAAYAHIGYTARDFTGQYSIKDGNSIFFNYETYKGGKKPGYMYELGTKYYFEKVPSGNYIAAAFSTIINTRVRDLTDEFIPVNIDSESYSVHYASKEIKLMLGKASDASEKFYTDFAFGGGLRFLKYDDVKFTTQGDALEINKYLYVKSFSQSVKKEIKPWLFLTYKIGYRF